LLDVLTAKPIRAVDYFTVKLAASSAAFASFYLFGVVGALCSFPWRLKGFVVSDFLALSAVHFFAAIFAATFAGTIALFFKRKLTGLLVSIIVLGTLVGSSWLGFINPAYLTISYFNPFFQGISVIAKIQNYGAWDIIQPIIVLIMFNLLMLTIGRHRARVVLEDRQAFVRPDKARRDETKASAAPQLSLSPRLSSAQHVYTGAGRIAHGATGSFKAFLLSESLKAFRLRHVLSLIGLTLMGLILTFWLPSFPESVFRFFSRVLDLPSWPQIHDRLGCFSCSDRKSADYAFARYIYRANVGLHPFSDFHIPWHVLHLQARYLLRSCTRLPRFPSESNLVCRCRRHLGMDNNGGIGSGGTTSCICSGIDCGKAGAWLKRLPNCII
jgi:hypothetical protein